MSNSVQLQRSSFGIALVLVLWVIVILSIMAASFSLNLRREIDLLRNAREEAEAGPVAEAGIYYAMRRLIEANREKKWRTDGSVYEVSFGGGRVRVRIYDEGGKYDLNVAPDPMLTSLLQHSGLDPDKAAALVGAIADWKDSDDLQHIPAGAEAHDYEDADRSYGPRNKPFQTIEELGLVLGVTRDLYRKLEPLITVYGAQAIDVTKASKEVLMTMPGVTEPMVDAYLQQRAQTAQIIANTEVDNLTPTPQPFSFNLPPGWSMNPDQDTGSAYSVDAEALFPDGRRARISAVIKNIGDPQQPFVFLEFKKQISKKGSLFENSVVVVQNNGNAG
ncbi:MAG: general secretion pathway protein GspK [Methylococcales bacterium]